MKKTIFLGLFLLNSLISITPIKSEVLSMSGKIPPGQPPQDVSLELAIMHIYDINLDHQTVRLSGYFRQSWNDSRMMSNQSDGIDKNGRGFFLMNKAQALWYPDTFISNSIDHHDRQSFAGDPQGAYHYFRVYTDGEVLYSQMIDILIKTQMNLKYYPFNILNISLDVESYGYPEHTLRYSSGISSKNSGLQIEIKNVPGYKINSSLANSYLTSAEYSTGNFSKIEMSFSLIPNDSSLFILSIPNLLLIVISSFVFWMDVKKKLSERLSLGITAMLADFALSFSLPVPATPDFLYVREYINISYIFIGFSIFFTFMEYIIVSYFYNVKTLNFNRNPNSFNNNNNSRSPNARPKDSSNFDENEINYSNESYEDNYNSKIKDAFISRSIKNLRQNFYKLLNINELMRNSLHEYMDSSYPEEPVMPIKAALGIFYLSCWISFMVGHIIPGKIIVDKAKLGIDYHEKAVGYFPFIISLGLGLSFFFSVIAFFIQYKTRKRWYERKGRREEYMDRTSSVMDFNIINKPPNSPRLVSHNLSNSPARQHIHTNKIIQ